MLNAPQQLSHTRRRNGSSCVRTNRITVCLFSAVLLYYPQRHIIVRFVLCRIVFIITPLAGLADAKNEAHTKPMHSRKIKPKKKCSNKIDHDIFVFCCR